MLRRRLTAALVAVLLPTVVLAQDPQRIADDPQPVALDRTQDPDQTQATTDQDKPNLRVDSSPRCFITWATM